MKKNKILMIGLGFTATALGFTACGSKEGEILVNDAIIMEPDISIAPVIDDEENEVSSDIEDTAEIIGGAAVEVENTDSETTSEVIDSDKKLDDESDETISKEIVEDKSTEESEVSEQSVNQDEIEKPEQMVEEKEEVTAYIEEKLHDEEEIDDRLDTEIMSMDFDLYLYGCPMSSSTMTKISDAEKFNENDSMIIIS